MEQSGLQKEVAIALQKAKEEVFKVETDTEVEEPAEAENEPEEVEAEPEEVVSSPVEEEVPSTPVEEEVETSVTPVEAEEPEDVETAESELVATTAAPVEETGESGAEPEGDENSAEPAEVESEDSEESEDTPEAFVFRVESDAEEAEVESREDEDQARILAVSVTPVDFDSAEVQDVTGAEESIAAEESITAGESITAEEPTSAEDPTTPTKEPHEDDRDSVTALLDSADRATSVDADSPEVEESAETAASPSVESPTVESSTVTVESPTVESPTATSATPTSPSGADPDFREGLALCTNLAELKALGGYFGEAIPASPSNVSAPDTTPSVASTADQTEKPSLAALSMGSEEGQPGPEGGPEERVSRSVSKPTRPRAMKTYKTDRRRSSIDRQLSKRGFSASSIKRGWVIWMIARIDLNDPDLTSVDLSHHKIPHNDSLALPRLIEALCTTNTHLKKLQLNNCGLDSEMVGRGFGRVLEENKTLTHLELDTNPLDTDSLTELFSGLTGRSVLQTLKISNLIGLSSSQRVERLMMESIQGNTSLLELGFHLKEAHSRDTINRKLMKNRDILRVRRNTERRAAELAEAEAAEAQATEVATPVLVEGDV